MFGFSGRYDSRELIDGCEAFLGGRLAEHLLAEGAAIPVWAWTNLLAHGTEEQLRGAPTRDRRLPPMLEPWAQARRYLAGEILELVTGNGVPLLTVQREALVPVELELARGVDPGYGLADWVGQVERALAPRQARARRHPPTSTPS